VVVDVVVVLVVVVLEKASSGVLKGWLMAAWNNGFLWPAIERGFS
jgi:hypothetical protein